MFFRTTIGDDARWYSSTGTGKRASGAPRWGSLFRSITVRPIARAIPKDKQPATLRAYVSATASREYLLCHDRFRILSAAHCFYELRHKSFHGDVGDQTERNRRRDFPIGNRMATGTMDRTHSNFICYLAQMPDQLPTPNKDNLYHRPGNARNIINASKKIGQLGWLHRSP